MAIVKLSDNEAICYFLTDADNALCAFRQEPGTTPGEAQLHDAIESIKNAVNLMRESMIAAPSPEEERC